jgi:thioesterase domain-containing protein
LKRYRAQHYDQPVLMLRPKPHIAYNLIDGRQLNTDRCVIKPDNGWSPYLSALVVKEVPGDHDAMVLEPCVRVLATYIREALRSACQWARLQAMAAE